MDEMPDVIHLYNVCHVASGLYWLRCNNSTRMLAEPQATTKHKGYIEKVMKDVLLHEE